MLENKFFEPWASQRGFGLEFMGKSKLKKKLIKKNSNY